MKTKNYFSNSAKTAIAIVTTVVTMMGMTACSADDEFDQLASNAEMTRVPACFFRPYARIVASK